MKDFSPEQRKEIKLSHSSLTLQVIYPDNNPPQALDDVVKGLSYLGLFDGIKKN